jgi:hypothetical protein
MVFRLTPLLYTERGPAVCSGDGNFYNSLTAFTMNLTSPVKTPILRARLWAIMMSRTLRS